MFLDSAPTHLLNSRRELADLDVQAARPAKRMPPQYRRPRFRRLRLDAERAAKPDEWNQIEEILPRMCDQLERLKTAIAR